MKTINYETKEQLESEYEQAIREFDKPIWDIRKYADDQIWLFKNGVSDTQLVLNKKFWKESFVEDFSQLVYKIADAMGYLATPEQILDKNKSKYKIVFENSSCEFISGSAKWCADASYIIDTKEHDEEIIELINNFPVIKEWIKFCKGGE